MPATDAIDPEQAPPRPILRLAAAIAIGLLSGAFLAGFTLQRRLPGLASPSDLAVQWFCARGLFAGQDPYLLSGPGRAFEWPAPVMYPATALVALWPFTWLDVHRAEVAFVALGAAAFAYVGTRRSWVPLCAVLGAPFSLAVTTAQWSPWLAGAALSPALAWLVAAKPSVGLAIAAYRPDWRWIRGAVLGSAVLAAVAFALQPGWVTAWLGALATPPGAELAPGGAMQDLYTSPLALPGGLLLLLALARWRRPEARLLVVLGAVPQIMSGYELVPLLALVPATFAEGLLLAAGSWVARYGFVLAFPYASMDAAYVAAGRWTLWCVLVPATMLVLRRANVGEVPRWVDRAAAVVARRAAHLRARVRPL